MEQKIKLYKKLIKDEVDKMQDVRLLKMAYTFCRELGSGSRKEQMQ